MGEIDLNVPYTLQVLITAHVIRIKAVFLCIINSKHSKHNSHCFLSCTAEVLG